MNWYVMHVRWGRELAVAAQLESILPLTTYCPQVCRQRQAAHWVEPLFPGYLFAQPHDESFDPAALEHTPGCGVFLRRLAGPAAGAAGGAVSADEFVRLDPVALDELHCRLQAVNAAGGLPINILRPLGQDDHAAHAARAHAGAAGDPPPALADALDGLLTPSARVQVLLRSCLAQPPAGRAGLAAAHGIDADACSDERPFHLLRRTRGKGRWIHYL